MTVKQLKAYLETFNENAPVYVERTGEHRALEAFDIRNCLMVFDADIGECVEPPKPHDKFVVIGTWG